MYIYIHLTLRRTLWERHYDYPITDEETIQRSEVDLPKFLFFLIFILFIYFGCTGSSLQHENKDLLVAACRLLSCSMRTLSCGMHVGSSSLTRDGNQAPCSGSTESYPLDYQGSPMPKFLISRKNTAFSFQFIYLSHTSFLSSWSLPALEIETSLWGPHKCDHFSMYINNITVPLWKVLLMSPINCMGDQGINSVS